MLVKLTRFTRRCGEWYSVAKRDLEKELGSRCYKAYRRANRVGKPIYVWLCAAHKWHETLKPSKKAVMPEYSTIIAPRGWAQPNVPMTSHTCDEGTKKGK